MKCQFCDKPAAVHLTDIIKKQKREMHLCEECARERDLIPEPEQELNVPALLKFLLGKVSESAIAEPAHDICPQCGMKYAQFTAQGRLGCPGDYEAFHDELESLLLRIHQHTRHVGKVPMRLRARIQQAQREEMLQQLQNAVRDERYEDAALLRDQLRKGDTPDEPR